MQWQCEEGGNVCSTWGRANRTSFPMRTIKVCDACMQSGSEDTRLYRKEVCSCKGLLTPDPKCIPAFLVNCSFILVYLFGSGSQKCALISDVDFKGHCSFVYLVFPKCKYFRNTSGRHDPLLCLLLLITVRGRLRSLQGF